MSNHHHKHQPDGVGNFASKIDFLDSAMRRNTLPPEEILNLLPIQKDTSILDAGAGTGYFTIPAAKKTTGYVFALDMDARMLEVIDAKARTEGLTNVQLVQGNINDIPLPDGSVDIVLASLILHEVGALPPVLTQINRVIKMGGYFLCLEYEKEDSAVKGPPMHIRIPSAEMERQLIETGFKTVQMNFPRESIYVIVAQKTGVERHESSH